MSERGCWICHPHCSANMICDYPGVCKCKKGFYFIGILQGCARAIPYVESYFPPSGPISTSINISLKSLAKFTLSDISCKFNNTISPGIVLTQNLVQCKVPKFKITSKKELVQIYLSYDNATWSKQDFQFQIISTHKEINLTAFYIIAAVIIIVAAFISMKYFNFPKFGGNKGSGDDQPLLHSNENY
ncbi:hypothetical protein TVAG_433460 [Trichomonas vaginalis G3]|uniref:IPT/TIG domain-containing protein n=1 Tax=Trichomonas vaginalis (strain ATCC PRA-98 / G3) TaxID=412133 RepID=A2FJG8_TRIV3|nr:immunoglobulins domain-containing protein [Trichomonas vaginalis G3]XP_051107975.1 immunoglobulins domain-containing protein [Trichomonas vaginalis G3]EAX94938.1 hypothetical protein TVAG_433460 [Trichomonas vaginalis G3]KAI5544711.1 immunoglobulins domain-containing protein [Trichomonas vaginalis G3]KAI5544718.1 immunoglobulins domain-containing protein [Trichomonas vaginalis G3]|eukprot:XP_001307868.1 hypothetical protein [Trichomonas vaginalis G3]